MYYVERQKYAGKEMERENVCVYCVLMLKDSANLKKKKKRKKILMNSIRKNVLLKHAKKRKK